MFELVATRPPPDDPLGGGAIMRRKPPALNNIGIDRDPRALARFQCDYPFHKIHGCAHRFLAEYRFEGRELIYSDPPYLRHTEPRGGATVSATSKPAISSC